MGCFLACFGFSSRKKKRRRLPKTILIGDKSHGSYKPLDSYDVRVDLSITENENPVDSSGSPLSNKQTKLKVIKKVRFDLNVRAYEPIPPADTSHSLSEDGEEENKEDDGETIVDSRITMAGNRGQPLNHRYQNCIDSYDEDYELVYQDLDFDDVVESDDELDFYYDLRDVSSLDDSSTSKDGRPGFSNLHQKLEEQAPLIQPTCNTIGELKMHSADENAQYRSKYIHPVLTPVENVMQWKKIKAKESLLSLQQLQLQENKNNVDRDNKTPLPLSSELNSKCFKSVGGDVSV
ncbi:hypothetical protein SAY86_014599 [Trapa natans]|uniref:Uncharacterized protein n=1 Tax=Trapa natans TaxID=22666 RepID=A0AAN7QGT6_TRANT|nr:hypothetical protein SAY86_014599 [Trapa natans]